MPGWGWWGSGRPEAKTMRTKWRAAISMDSQFSTIGYGFLLEETLMLLDASLESTDAQVVRGSCIRRWPQKSESNKDKLWQHMKYRFLEIESNAIKNTPFLKMFRKIRTNDEAVQDLVFFQLCIATPILLGSVAEFVGSTPGRRFSVGPLRPHECE
jgi:hypothetical protein